ncbi:MAG TPA: biotin/lipoyl-binding carrier protein [Anaeromyxobacter sp.]
MKALHSPMAGTVWKVVVKPGDTLAAGDVAVLLESMKMEIPVEVESSGTVEEVLVAEGQVVDEGVVVLTYR